MIVRSYEKVKQFLLETPRINIFDVFAALHSYTSLRSGPVLQVYDEIETGESIDSEVEKFSHILPSTTDRYPRSPLDNWSRRQILAQIDYASTENEVALESFKIILAIDRTYQKLIAGVQSNISRRKTISPQLNLDDTYGRVYPRNMSSIFKDYLQRRVKYLSSRGKDVGFLRRGDSVRDRIENLVCVKIPDGYDLKLKLLDPNTRMQLPKKIKDWKIGIVPLINDINEVDRNIYKADRKQKIPYVFKGPIDKDNLEKKAYHCLKVLNNRKVSVVIFPELCMPKYLCDKIAKDIKNGKFPNIKMVVAGLFHIKSKDGWKNICHVLGPRGEVIWKQEKSLPYTTMDYEINMIRKNDDEFNKKSNNKPRYENIISSSPKTLTVCDTQLGRMAVLICSDIYNEPEYTRMMLDMNVNFLINPSFTGKITSRFTNIAREFAEKNQAVTIISNNCAWAKKINYSVGEKHNIISCITFPVFPSVLWFNCVHDIENCSVTRCISDFILKIGQWDDTWASWPS